MKIYRFKHKVTGLYYKPFTNNGNLSTNGKIYTAKYTLDRGHIYIKLRGIKETTREKILRKFYCIPDRIKGKSFNYDLIIPTTEKDWEIEYIDRDLS